MRPSVRGTNRAYLLAWRHEHGRHYAPIWRLRRTQLLVLGAVVAAGTLGVLAPSRSTPTERTQVAARIYSASTPHVRRAPFVAARIDVVARVDDVHLTTWRQPTWVVTRVVVPTTGERRDDARLDTATASPRVVVTSPTPVRTPAQVNLVPSSSRTTDTPPPSGRPIPTSTVAITPTSSRTVTSSTVAPTTEPPTPTTTPTPTPGVTTDATTTNPTPSSTGAASGTGSGSPASTP